MLLLLLVIYPAFINAQDKKEKDFENTVYTMVKAFEKNDHITINSFIHKKHKLVTMYRIGVADNFSFLDSLEAENMTQGVIMTNFKPLGGIYSDYKIKYGKHPEYDCGTEVWDKPPGLYTSRFQVDSVFTSAVRHFMEYDMDHAAKEEHISKEQFRAYRNLEKKSRKIFLLSKDGDSQVFSLTWINGKWYFTILDGVAGDCSA